MIKCKIYSQDMLNWIKILTLIKKQTNESLKNVPMPVFIPKVIKEIPIEDLC